MLTSPPPNIYIFIRVASLTHLTRLFCYTIVIGEFEHWTSLNDSVCFCGPKNEKKRVKRPSQKNLPTVYGYFVFHHKHLYCE